jgi:hypothetical protein
VASIPFTILDITRQAMLSTGYSALLPKIHASVMIRRCAEVSLGQVGKRSG